MSLLAKLSSWESDVLGVRVGLLPVDLAPSLNSVRADNAWKFDVIFVLCDRWLEPPEGAVATDHLYDMELETAGEKPKTSCVSMISFPGRKHIEIAMEALQDSRFLRDPRLAQKSCERYARWLSEHRVYTATENPDGAFLIVTDDPDGARRISLIAVSQEFRGSGIGTRLAGGVLAIEPSRQLWRVKVSARNHRAIRFYENLGFRVKNVSTVFHVWMTYDRER